MPQSHPLAEFRKTAGLTQRQAAAKVGVFRETWARWESGERVIDDKLLPKVAKLTGISKPVLRPDLAKLLGEAAE